VLFKIRSVFSQIRNVFKIRSFSQIRNVFKIRSGFLKSAVFVLNPQCFLQNRSVS